MRDEGYTVWRDSELPAHLSYAEVIEERLKSAKAVLVLWSSEAAKSQWVRAEADAAREMGTLVQSSVDGSIPPIPFNQIQCANLKGWSGEADHAGWRKLLSSIRALAGQAEQSPKSARKKKGNSICILPFQNKSDEEVPDFFCDGLSEDIITDLGKVAGISVVPRKAAFAFKGQDVDAADVAEQLGVAYVLEGAVRRAGDRVRITTQLVDVAGEQAWADRYHRDFNDVFSIQEEIAETIVDALKSRLAAEADEAPKGKAKAAKPAPAPVPEPEVVEAAAETEQAEPIDFEPDDAREIEESPAGWEDQDEYYYEPYDEDDEDGLIRRRSRLWGGDSGPRLIALAVIALAIAIGGYFLWPRQAETVEAPKAEMLQFTVIATVNVRSLPSRINSRILGTIDKGETINVVPGLAAAQPDWLKIADGPYVGGYVWRESTRPLSPNAASEAAPPVSAKPRGDVTG